MKNKALPALTLVALALQLAAPLASAAGTCSVSALDTVAGLGTEVTVTGCDASSSTTLTLQGPGTAASYTQAISLDTAGNAATLIPSKYTVTAGRYDFTVAGQSGRFTVLADRADDAR